MSRSGIARAVQIAIAMVSLTVGGTSHAGVVIGASFGYTHVSLPDYPRVKDDVVGLPSGQEWGQPGLRVGYLTPGGRWDLNADVGLLRRSDFFGRPVTTFELMPQAQVNLPARGAFVVFVNGGVGIEHQSSSTFGPISETRPVYGAGIGARRFVSERHGIVRAEMRYDHMPEVVKEQGPASTVTFLATDQFSLKLGFDLLLTR
jgi:hypothetical protein